MCEINWKLSETEFRSRGEGPEPDARQHYPPDERMLRPKWIGVEYSTPTFIRKNRACDEREGYIVDGLQNKLRVCFCEAGNDFLGIFWTLTIYYYLVIYLLHSLLFISFSSLPCNQWQCPMQLEFMLHSISSVVVNRFSHFWSLDPIKKEIPLGGRKNCRGRRTIGQGKTEWMVRSGILFNEDILKRRTTVVIFILITQVFFALIQLPELVKELESNQCKPSAGCLQQLLDIYVGGK